MTKRHDTRILAVLKLYELDFYSRNRETDDVDQSLESFWEMDNTILIKEIDLDYYQTLVKTVLDKQDEIDEILKKGLFDYSLSGLSYVDRAILRVGVAEMKYLKVPHAIAIDEAVEIAKDYSEIDGFKASAFDHKVLDSLVKAGLLDE